MMLCGGLLCHFVAECIPHSWWLPRLTCLS